MQIKKEYRSNPQPSTSPLFTSRRPRWEQWGNIAELLKWPQIILQFCKWVVSFILRRDKSTLNNNHKWGHHTGCCVWSATGGAVLVSLGLGWSLRQRPPVAMDCYPTQCCGWPPMVVNASVPCQGVSVCVCVCDYPFMYVFMCGGKRGLWLLPMFLTAVKHFVCTFSKCFKVPHKWTLICFDLIRGVRLNC